MTVHVSILKELMLAGYEGAHLYAAFERMCAAIAGDKLQVGQPRSATAMAKPANSVRSPVAVVPVRAVEVTAPPDNAKAIARKALLHSDLSASAAKVGSHLIERFNLKTGRCDPGVASMAKHLHLAERTVLRAVADLVAAGLFGRERHGGRAHANSYQPNWPALVARAAKADIVTVTKLSANPDKSVTQNHLTKPDSDSMVGRPLRMRTAQRPVDRRQGHLMLPVPGGRERSEQAVRSKLNNQLNEYLKPLGKLAFVEGLTHSMSVDWSPAVAAEMRRSGDGLPVLLDAIAAVGHRGRAAG